ncbi:MAG: hypothetical protein V1776_00120 [Candidatus Diapherotrites archaeon]
MRFRGQVGLEYLTFTAFLLLFSAILFAYAFVSYSSSVQLIQSQAAVDEVAATVDFVYAKGPGNTVLVDVQLPVGLTEFRVGQNTVRATLSQLGGSSTLFAFTKTNIMPAYLYHDAGIYTLAISMGDVNASVTNT